MIKGGKPNQYSKSKVLSSWLMIKIEKEKNEKAVVNEESPTIFYVCF